MDWKLIKLGDAATFINGFAFKPKDWSTEGKEIIRIANLTGSNSNFNYFKGSINEKYLVKKGDLLISWSATLGVFEWEHETEGWLNQHIFKVVFDKIEYDKGFFKYQIESVLHELERAVHGSTMKHITKKRFDAVEIPLPPLKTQQEIVEILDAAAALRDHTKKLLEEYDLLAQSIFLDMFGDPVLNEKGWEKSKMIDVCTKITDGTHDTPERITKGIKFITGKHIKPYSINYDESDYVTKEVHNEIYKRCNPEKHDVLYTNIGARLGTAALNVVDYEFSMKNVALFKPKREYLIGRFLEYFLNSENMKQKIIWMSSIGGAQKFLSLTQLRKLNIIIPPITLQNQFAEKIEIIEQQKELAKQELQESEDLFQGVLQKAFKGELV